MFGGVAFYLGSGIVEFTGSNIDGNMAMQDGGVVYMSTSAGAEVKFDHCQLQNNKADAMGSVIFAGTDATCIVTNCEINHNVAGSAGGYVVLLRFDSLEVDESFFSRTPFFR
jgi:hypothetical protein